jgi:O-succinylbenzoic acid--CoA ligase
VYDGVPLPGVAVDVGERVRLSGPVVGRGYRLRPDLTAEAFAGDTFTTGDVGRWDGDRLQVLGRADDLVVTGGEKVAPLAVEAALAEHPSVAEVVVVGVPDAEWGARVVAHVVLRRGAALTLAEAREHVAARLGRVAAPRQLEVLDAVPALPSGKPDRAVLRSRS